MFNDYILKMPKDLYMSVRNFPLYYQALTERQIKETDEVKLITIKTEKKRILDYYDNKVKKKKEDLIELLKLIDDLKSSYIV